MTSWFIILNIIVLLHSMSSIASFPYNDNSLTESTWPKNLANEQQIAKFADLIFKSLNLKEPPNVTVNIGDGTGIPSIVKQIEQQHIHDNEVINYYREEKLREENQPTTERAILPGGFIPHHTCQRQLATKLNLNKENLHNIDCFLFTKSLFKSNSLPTNQIIKQLRIYVKKTYFHLNNIREDLLAPDMFQIYQVFRPTSNETKHTLLSGLTDTISLSINQVKPFKDDWLELTIEPNNGQITIQQLYQQFITPWYGLAINRELQLSWSRSYRRYYSKKNLENFFRSEDISEELQHQSLYMVVDYGEKFSSFSYRKTRTVKARPARPCDPTSPCCRRPLFIDLDKVSNDLNFVIYPRKLDIGQCIGLCGPGGSSLKHTDIKNDQLKNKPGAANHFILIHHNGKYYNNGTATGQLNKADPQSTHCCSFSRTGGIEIMYQITNGGPIIRKFIPNIIVEDCKCGLPATIQQ